MERARTCTRSPASVRMAKRSPTSGSSLSTLQATSRPMSSSALVTRIRLPWSGPEMQLKNSRLAVAESKRVEVMALSGNLEVRLNRLAVRRRGRNRAIAGPHILRTGVQHEVESRKRAARLEGNGDEVEAFFPDGLGAGRLGFPEQVLSGRRRAALRQP